MADRFALHVFAYDIPSDRTRRKIADHLEEYGLRVQDSVFEIRATRAGARALADRLVGFLTEADSLRVYVISAEGRAQSFNIGGPPISEQQEFWLV